MGLYNPHFPHIIGEEWVPIRNEDLQFSPAVSSVEMGYEFIHQNNTDIINSARYYIRKWPTRIPGASLSLFLSQPFFVQLYSAGTEAETGPIQVVRIPVSSGAVGSPASLSNAANVQQALSSPIDGRKVIISATTTPLFGSVDLNFAVSSYNQLLLNKRIIAVNIVYNAVEDTDTNSSFLTVNINGGQDINYGLATFEDQGTVRLGDTNWWYSTTTPGLSFPSPFPWTPVSLRRFEGTHASPITTTFEANSDEPFVEAAQWSLFWAALEVYYCEEKRLIMGGGINLNQGVNQTTLYTPNEVSSSLTLGVKKYTLMLAAADTGDSRGDFSQSALLAQPYPSLNALRQLYPTTYHRGMQINHPSPVGSNIVDKTFTVEEIDVLPQVTLQRSSGSPDVLGDVHPYGTQVAAQVYGSNFATQTIEDTFVGNVTTQQVRYYARRFGNTSSRLELIRTSNPTSVIASLSPAEFDELEPEDGIIDGWKEVTLTLDSPQTFTGTRPSFKWQAVNETAGDRWEILAMLALAVSGNSSNVYNPAPSVYNLGHATYGWPVSGSSDALQWFQVPPSIGVSAMPSSVDQAADAVLMFAVNPPSVTGFAITEMTQALSGIPSSACGDDCCTPTGLYYHHLEWDMGQTDTFTRTVAAGGWGTADTGDAWTVASGTASHFSVNGTTGVVTVPNNADDFITQPKSFVDVEVAATLWLSLPVSGAEASVSVLARYTDTSNFYRGRVTLQDTGLMDIAIIKRFGGVSTDLQVFSNSMHFSVDTRYRLTFNVTGSMLRFTVERLDADDEVVERVVIYAQDTSITGAGVTGLRFFTGGTTSSINSTVEYVDDFCAYPAALGDGGHYELQRMDAYTDWQTIMRGSACAWYLNDYESRVGISSTYRVRIVDSLNFAGPWSAEVSHTLTSPGITGPTCVDGSGSLIFTSNYAQNGRYNLAYIEVFDPSNTHEDFVFPEAQTVQLQRVYKRDFPIATKGTERGGEQFGRVLLVHNAAIDPIRLADMEDLRDMAWAQLPYVCVRDEIGDRWLALVTVPGSSVRRNRQLYLASITVSEVADTAFPVDPVVNT